MNINLRPTKCSGQSRRGRYGSYATVYKHVLTAFIIIRCKITFVFLFVCGFLIQCMIWERNLRAIGVVIYHVNQNAETPSNFCHLYLKDIAHSHSTQLPIMCIVKVSTPKLCLQSCLGRRDTLIVLPAILLLFSLWITPKVRFNVSSVYFIPPNKTQKCSKPP